jgi:mannitol/fructose-specific phosphotransferase system IIA component (Ntr-type)
MTKLRSDLENRERKATTGIGGGIAIPHVRTMQAKEFTICFARSTPGLEFGAVDGQPVHLFFGVVAPPYDDKLYLEVYKTIGELLSEEATREALMKAESEHEVIKVISQLG